MFRCFGSSRNDGENATSEDEDRILTKFSLLQPIEKSVSVRGSWDDFRGRTAMKSSSSKDLKSVYEVEIPLKPGKYLFRYYVDGKSCLAKLKPVETYNGESYSVLHVLENAVNSGSSRSHGTIS
uniref:AMP-activated protein kinase glycogen-binding domain-containing protein n=1 Tax=Rhodosorus marinus TaxID=101924 RepID=A0A7S2ZLZ6_9RHOD|mmetsp:Transcript_23670/g.93387  ORF Transcript_23670/g.93387 Transcript_23670/m.93387 type:complete len:124 (+) Transcript_23670:155-526(+)